LSQQPVPETCSAERNTERAAPRFPIWPCTRWGFPCPGGHPPGGGLLPHLFTLTPSLRAGRFVFCGTLRRNALKHSARVYPRKNPGLRGIAPSGVRTFLLRPLRDESDSPPFRNQGECSVQEWKWQEWSALVSAPNLTRNLNPNRQKMIRIRIKIKMKNDCYSATARSMSRVQYKMRPQFGQVTSSRAAWQETTSCTGNFMWQPPHTPC